MPRPIYPYPYKSKDQITIQGLTNVLPVVDGYTEMFLSAILQNGTLHRVAITEAEVIYGNATIVDNLYFIPRDTKPICIKAQGFFGADFYGGIFYIQAIDGGSIAPNSTRLQQAFCKGVFSSLAANTPQGLVLEATAQMLNDYYEEYFNVVALSYNSIYSRASEYEYNDTVGLLANSFQPNNLIAWFGRLPAVKLTAYDLELAISQYIYYRLGLSCPVYIDEAVIDPADYWNLGVPGFTELGDTTILAPSSSTGAVSNLAWTIYNSDDINNDIRNEIQNLIIRISRADIGNPVTFSSIIDPADDNFNLIGPTYINDRRILYGKCLQFTGDQDFPENIIGYKKKGTKL